MNVKKGDAIKVHYKGTLDDGNVFDSSEGREPLAFTVGQGHVIPGFDNAMEGMQVNETKKVHIPSAEAYGEYSEENVLDVPVGQRLFLLHPQSGQPVPVKVMKAENGVVVLDANHELAGQNLNFEITLHAIGDTTEEDHDQCGCGGSCQH
ncbi:MAG: FKBP-type peptidyl-prolyl cis-trans isomerase [Brevinema sp.]